MEITKIFDIYNNKEELSKLEKIKVGGWVKTFRQKKFVELNDGSTLDNLQIVISENFPQKDLLNRLNFASSLVVIGQLILTPGRPQPCELQEVKIESLNFTDEDYPFQKNKIPLDVVRNFPHLRTKTNYFLSLFRLRHSVSKAIHDFF